MPDPTITKQHVRQLWRLMAASFGYRWAQSYGTLMIGDGADRRVNPTVLFWQQQLGDLQPEQVSRGVQRCIDAGLDWPPSLGEFRQLCLPDRTDIGAPDPAVAWDELRDGNHHPLLAATEQSIKADLGMMRTEQAMRVFTAAYRRRLDDALRRAESADRKRILASRKHPPDELATDRPATRTCPGCDETLGVLQAVCHACGATRSGAKALPDKPKPKPEPAPMPANVKALLDKMGSKTLNH